MRRLSVLIAVIALVRVAESRNEVAGTMASSNSKSGDTVFNGVNSKNLTSSRLQAAKMMGNASYPGERLKIYNKTGSLRSEPDLVQPSLYSEPLSYENQLHHLMNEVYRMFNDSDHVPSASPDLARHAYGGGGLDTSYLYGDMPYQLYPQSYLQNYDYHQPSLLSKPVLKPTLAEHEVHLKPLPALPIIKPLPSLPTIKPMPVATKPTTVMTGLLSKLPMLAKLIEGVLGGGSGSDSTGLLSTLVTVIPQVISLKNSLRGVISKGLVPLVILILINIEIIALVFWLWEDCPKPQMTQTVQAPAMPSYSPYSHLPSASYRFSDYLMPPSTAYMRKPL